MKKIFLVFLIFLSGCATFMPTKTYLSKNSEFRSNYSNIMFLNINEKNERLAAYFPVVKCGWGIFLFIVPIPVPNSNCVDRVNIDSNFDIIMTAGNRNDNIDFDKLHIFLQKNNIIYNSTMEKKNGFVRHFGVNGNIGVYTFPITIKKLGKETATLIFEYESERKEIQFKFGTRWEIRF